MDPKIFQFRNIIAGFPPVCCYPEQPGGVWWEGALSQAGRQTGEWRLITSSAAAAAVSQISTNITTNTTYQTVSVPQSAL